MVSPTAEIDTTPVAPGGAGAVDPPVVVAWEDAWLVVASPPVVCAAAGAGPPPRSESSAAAPVPPATSRAASTAVAAIRRRRTCRRRDSARCTRIAERPLPYGSRCDNLAVSSPIVGVEERILDAVGAGREELIELTCRLIAFDTTARDIDDPP